MVKALRQETGAGFADCKQALAENAGDVAKARDWLRLRRSKLASKKSERATSEGVIAFAGDEADGVLIELLAETDFVANNEQFREVAAQIATALAKSRPTTTKIEPASLAACAHDAGTLEDLRQSDGTLGYSPNLRHGVIGKGMNDYPAILDILVRHGYGGWISIEDGVNGLDEMQESLRYLRELCQIHFGEGG